MRHRACPAALAPRRRCRLCRRSPSRARPLFTPVSTARTGSAPDYGCWYCPLRPVREDTTLCHLACSGLPTALGETAAAEGKGPRRPRKRENGVIATRNPRRRRQRLEGTERTRPKRGPAGRTPDRAHAYGPEGGARGPGPRRGSQGSRRGRKNHNRVSRAGGPSTRRRFHSRHLSGLGGYVLGGRLGQGKGPLSGQRGRDAAPPAPPGPAVRQLPAPPRAREEGALHLPRADSVLPTQGAATSSALGVSATQLGGTTRISEERWRTFPFATSILFGPDFKQSLWSLTNSGCTLPQAPSHRQYGLDGPRRHQQKRHLQDRRGLGGRGRQSDIRLLTYA